MSANELDLFLRSFDRPNNYPQEAWDHILRQSKSIWKAYLEGKKWQDHVAITCKESYLMLVNRNGQLILGDDSLLDYVCNEHTKNWKEKLESIALRAICEKRYEKAELYFGKALKVDARSDINHYRRAMVRMKLNKVKEAAEDLGRAISIQPENEVYYLKRAQALRILDVDHKAMTDLNKAIRLNPQYAEAFQVRGQFRTALGDTAGGKMDMARARQLFDQKIGEREVYGNRSTKAA